MLFANDIRALQRKLDAPWCALDAVHDLSRKPYPCEMWFKMSVLTLFADELSHLPESERVLLMSKRMDISFPCEYGHVIVELKHYGINFVELSSKTPTKTTTKTPKTTTTTTLKVKTKKSPDKQKYKNEDEEEDEEGEGKGEEKDTDNDDTYFYANHTHKYGSKKKSETQKTTTSDNEERAVPNLRETIEERKLREKRTTAKVKALRELPYAEIGNVLVLRPKTTTYVPAYICARETENAQTRKYCNLLRFEVHEDTTILLLTLLVIGSTRVYIRNAVYTHLFTS